MNLSTLLVTPWRVTDRSQCWLMLALFVLCMTVAIAIGYFDNHPPWWPLATGLYCAGIVFFWAFQMPFLLLVSIDATRLRAPGIARTAAWSVILYAALCVIAPAAALAPVGADPTMVALAAALTVTGGLAFALLPRYALLLGYVLIFVLQGGLRLLHISSPDHPSHATLVQLGFCALTALLALDVSRWHTLTRGSARHLTGMRSALVLRLADNLQSPPGSSDVRVTRNAPTWLQPRVELRGVDRTNPVRSMRVALGRGIMPVTLQSHLRQLAFGVVALAFALLVIFATGPADDAHPLLRQSWFWLLVGGFVVVAISSSRLTAVRQRWRGKGSDLAVLGLLPGLGSPIEQKRRLLYAILLQPLWWLLGALLVCWSVVGVTHASAVIDAYALVAVFGSGALLGASVLASLGGWPIGNFMLGVLFVALLALLALTVGFDALPSLFLDGSIAAIPSTRMFLLACWLAWLSAVGALGLRGWRLLQRRPHPFLANPP